MYSAALSITPDRNRSARPRLTTVLAVMVTALLYGLPLAFGALLVPPLEKRFEKTSAEFVERASGLIVLGGAGDTRIRAAGNLARRYPHLILILTGTGYSRSELEHVLGDDIAPSRLWIEEHAQNTHENALLTSRLLAGRSNESWLLVTSATHMPRAMGAFRRQNVAVRPWPLADTPDDWDARNRIALHEWAGLVAYRLRGQSSELLPSHTVNDADGGRVIQARASSED